MLTVGKTYTLEVDAAKAGEILSQNGYKRQRVLRPKTVTLYADKMENGHWVPGSPIKFVLWGDKRNPKRVLVDGQHRLHAVVKTGAKVQFAVTEIWCDDENEAARVYYTTDRNAVRGYGDIFAATGVQEELGLTKTDMNAAASSVRFIDSGFLKNNTFQDEDDLLHKVLEYQDAIVLYFAATAGCDRRMSVPLRRNSVMAVGLVTFRYSAGVYGNKKVEDFWEGVALDDGLKQGDPRKVANVHLMTTRMPNGAMIPGFRTVSAAYQARWIANCFNAWAEGREYKVTEDRRSASKVYDSSAPIEILGSPFKG